jgi:hypothetical protein
MKFFLALTTISTFVAIAVTLPYDSSYDSSSSSSSTSTSTSTYSSSELIRSIHEYFHDKIITINEKLTESITVSSTTSLEVEASGTVNGHFDEHTDFKAKLKESVHIAITADLKVTFSEDFWNSCDRSISKAISEYCDLDSRDFASCVTKNVHRLSSSASHVFYGYMDHVREHLQVHFSEKISESVEASFEEKKADLGYEKIEIKGKSKFTETIKESVSIWIDEWETKGELKWQENLETTLKEHFSSESSHSESEHNSY